MGGAAFVSIADIQEEARKVALEWWALSDNLAKEPFYTIEEQHNHDYTSSKLKGVLIKTLSSTITTDLQKDPRNGIKKRIVTFLGQGLVWYTLRAWSHVFLAKKTQGLDYPNQRLGQSHKWLHSLLIFENHMRRFLNWMDKFFPNCSSAQLIKASRLLWVIMFLCAIEGHFDWANEEAIFAFTALYPIVDDFMDKGSDQRKQNDLVSLIKNYLFNQSDQLVPPDPLDANTALMLQLLGKVIQPFKSNQEKLDLIILLLNQLLELETQKKPTDILFTAACKGGFTLCIAKLLIKENFAIKDLSLLLRLGFAIQTADDLQDVEEDVAEGNNTLATPLVYKSQELRRQYSRCLNFIRHCIFDKANWEHWLHFQEGLCQVLIESLCLLCFEAAAHSLVLNQEDKLIILQHSPISIDFLQTHKLEESLFRLLCLMKHHD